MSKTQNVSLKGIISKVHANAQFSVKIEKIEKPLICYLAGKISKKTTKPIVGDTVDIEVYPQDLSKGRIMKIYK